MRLKNKKKISQTLMTSYLTATGGSLDNGVSELAIQTAVDQELAAGGRGANRRDEREDRMRQALVNMEYQQQMLSQHVFFANRVHQDRRGSFDEEPEGQNLVGRSAFYSGNTRNAGIPKTLFHRGS